MLPPQNDGPTTIAWKFEDVTEAQLLEIYRRASPEFVRALLAARDRLKQASQAPGLSVHVKAALALASGAMAIGLVLGLGSEMRDAGALSIEVSIARLALADLLTVEIRDVAFDSQAFWVQMVKLLDWCRDAVQSLAPDLRHAAAEQAAPIVADLLAGFTTHRPSNEASVAFLAATATKGSPKWPALEQLLVQAGFKAIGPEKLRELVKKAVSKNARG